MDFRILIDSSLIELGLNSFITPHDNKRILSLINDFECGKWRTEKFNNFVWDNIAETALSHKEREALQFQPASLLKNAAKNLRLANAGKDVGRGGELAEIFLYGIMKHKYKALPVVPKIFYKQNSQDNAKGADSVHIVIDENKNFTLWFGEAKFYNNIEDARLDAIVESVGNSLNADKLKKENSIITSISDIDMLDIDTSLKQEIKSCLSNRNSIDSIKSIINIPILLLHECATTELTTEISGEYIEKIKKHHMERGEAYFKKTSQ